MALQSLTPFIGRAVRMDLATFVAEHPHPVLVIEPFVLLESDAVQTISADSLSQGSLPTIGVLSKRPGGNAFGHMVTLGRARNNDVILKAAGVSKFHCYFMFSPGEPAVIVDAGSSNGTFVAGARVAAQAKTPLNPGDAIGIARVGAVFHTPETFHAYLRAQLEG
ncbi:MAG: FHA domain-containing protein [Planctomycetes bacterium]|nr:FHA domain-containing protein [Planctomycetota bacterium]